MAVDRLLIPAPQVRRILVCQLRQIGDVLLATPAIRLLKGAFPQAEVHVFTEARCAPVLENNPHIARIWAVDKKQLSSLPRELAFYFRVARQRFDLVVDFQQLPRIRWVVALSRLLGCRWRLSYDPPWYNRWLYSHVTRPRDGYAAMCKASVLEPLGLAWRGERPELFLRPEERDWAEDYLASHELEDRTLVTVDPSHRRATRRWPAAHFGRLLGLAAAQRPDARFLIAWGPGERDLAREVAAASGSPACVVPDAMLTLRQLAAVQEKAVLHFGTCSAPRHLAVAVGAPTLAVLGSTSDAWTYPSPEHGDVRLGLPCQPCNRNECDTMRCLTDLAPEAVLPELLRRLDAAVEPRS
ncbi:MAG: glycosyltransferase family 9 protein [Thermodesulfobacteriota bacterium]